MLADHRMSNGSWRSCDGTVCAPLYRRRSVLVARGKMVASVSLIEHQLLARRDAQHVRDVAVGRERAQIFLHNRDRRFMESATGVLGFRVSATATL